MYIYINNVYKIGYVDNKHSMPLYLLKFISLLTTLIGFHVKSHQTTFDWQKGTLEKKRKEIPINPLLWLSNFIITFLFEVLQKSEYL